LSSVADHGAAAGAAAVLQAGARVVVEHVRREFGGNIVALDDVSLTLEPGEFVALSGPSGSGKTTLLSVVGGLDVPTSGSVTVDGRVIDGNDTSRYHREVTGFVFQHHYLLLHLTAEANVALPLIATGLRGAARRERAAHLLADVGLAHRSDALTAHLSGGERQRVAVARALANEPRLLLADEPTGALDSEGAQNVLDLFGEIRSRRGTTILIVTHDQLVAARADRRLVLRDGRLVDN
jgi:putative ABC transport system ATP-binding protein